MTSTAPRTELGLFLRSRRERIKPETVGLTTGLRRRTPGLRREEVAQLSGVGVTWYTWLEQGRPINVSAHVLNAVARTLGLDGAEREHLYRLAEVPQPPDPGDATTEIPGHLDEILHTLDPLPAVLVDDRTEILRWNTTYAAVHPALVTAPAGERSTIWNLFAVSPEQSHIMNRDEQAPEAVATFRYRYSRHLKEPRWLDLIARLGAASPLFARLWDTQNVAPPVLCDKRYDFPGIGEIGLRPTVLDLTGPSGIRLVVHTPIDEDSRRRIGQIIRRASGFEHVGHDGLAAEDLLA